MHMRVPIPASQWTRYRHALADSVTLNAARGLVFVTHLFPAVVVSLAGMVFYLLVADEGQRSGWVLMFGSTLLIPAAIGSMNDYCDLALDRRAKRNKPLVRGDIQPRTALVLSCAAATAGVLLSACFGWKTSAIALLVLASGLVYDFWAKGTIWSWVPYAIAVPALPVWAFVAADKLNPVLLMTFPLGALVALASNLANTLPDLNDDIQLGLRGLAHRLGLRRSLLAIWCSFGTTLTLLAGSGMILGNRSSLFFPGLMLGTVLWLVMIADYAANASNESLKRGWYYTAILTGLLGGTWVACLSSL
jgi:4-hydroxybenzoate polyprenyltransferase